MITSKTNELIKHIKNLHQKKFREEYGEFFVEGKKLVLEAISENLQILKIIVCEELFSEELAIEAKNIEYVDKKVFEFISDTKTPQGIMAILKIPEKEQTYEKVIFALDDLQDPGNLGTIIRTLDCAGINTLILSEGTADIYNPKVVRSTMGAIYRVNCFEKEDLREELMTLKEKGYKVVITALDAEINHYGLDFTDQKYVIVIGNESKGVSNEIQALADVKVKIPMLGRTESLNASVAASIMAYEYVRYIDRRGDVN